MGRILGPAGVGIVVGARVDHRGQTGIVIGHVESDPRRALAMALEAAAKMGGDL